MRKLEPSGWGKIVDKSHATKTFSGHLCSYTSMQFIFSNGMIGHQGQGFYACEGNPKCAEEKTSK